MDTFQPGDIVYYHPPHRIRGILQPPKLAQFERTNPRGSAVIRLKSSLGFKQQRVVKICQLIKCNDYKNAPADVTDSAGAR